MKVNWANARPRKKIRKYEKSNAKENCSENDYWHQHLKNKAKIPRSEHIEQKWPFHHGIEELKQTE